MNSFFLKGSSNFLHSKNNRLQYPSYALENLFQNVNYILQNFHLGIFETQKKEEYCLIHVFHNSFNQAFEDSYLLDEHIHYIHLKYI